MMRRLASDKVFPRRVKMVMPINKMSARAGLPVRRCEEISGEVTAAGSLCHSQWMRATYITAVRYQSRREPARHVWAERRDIVVPIAKVCGPIEAQVKQKIAAARVNDSPKKKCSPS